MNKQIKILIILVLIIIIIFLLTIKLNKNSTIENLPDVSNTINNLPQKDYNQVVTIGEDYKDTPPDIKNSTSGHS